MRHLFFAILLAACGGAGPTGEPVFKDWCKGCRGIDGSAVAGEKPKPDWCKTHRCEVAGVRTFTPDWDLEQTACKAMQRWSAASGIEMRLGSIGIPIVFLDELWNPDPDNPEVYLLPLKPACGLTHISWDDDGNTEIASIEINRNPPEGCEDLDHIVLHEMGHALTGNGLHTKRGVMSPVSSPNGLDDVSLSFICEYEPCTVFNPERYLWVNP